QALDHEVVARAVRVRARLSEPRDRAVDEARIDLPQAFVVEAILAQPSYLEVLYEYIAHLCQLTNGFGAFWGGDVDFHGKLVAVRAEIVGSLARLLALRVAQVGRAPFSRIVAGASPFDLDDFSAEVAQGLRAPWASQYAREVEYT